MSSDSSPPQRPVEDGDVERMKELISFIACALVDDPDAVDVAVFDEERELHIELTVAQEDLGKVIGKEGRTARAMRTLLASTSARLRKRAILDILE